MKQLRHYCRPFDLNYQIQCWYMLINFLEFWAITSFYVSHVVSPHECESVFSGCISLVDHSPGWPIFEAAVCGSSNKCVSQLHNECLEFRMRCPSNIDLTLFCGMQHPCAPPNLLLGDDYRQDQQITLNSLWCFLIVLVQAWRVPTTAAAFSTIFPPRKTHCPGSRCPLVGAKLHLSPFEGHRIRLKVSEIWKMLGPLHWNVTTAARSQRFAWCGFRTGRSLTDLSCRDDLMISPRKAPHREATKIHKFTPLCACP